MKILKMSLVEDTTRPTRAVFDFEYQDIRFRGWKIICQENIGLWVAAPSYRDYEGDGRLHGSVKFPPEVKTELDTLALDYYERTAKGKS